MEDDILEWIDSRRLKGLRVSRKLITKKALLLSRDQQKMDNFTAGNGWIQKFMRWHGLSLRRRTTVVQKDPEQLISLTSWLRMFYKLEDYRDFLAINPEMLLQWTKLKFGRT